MAAITSAGTGNWNVGGTWVGGVAPGDGDTATIASGHTVTIPAAVTVTVGSSPATGGTAAITGTGILVVNGTLNIKGDAAMTNSAGTTFGPGFVLNIIVPTGTQYNFKGGTTYTNYSPLIFNGTSGSRGTVTATLTGTGVATLQGGGSNSNGFIQATYTDFSNLGSASVEMVKCFFNTTRTLSFANCTFTNCGQINGQNFADGDSFVLTNNAIYSPVSSQFCFSLGFTAARTSGTRQITNNYFEQQINVGFKDLTMYNNIFNDGVYVASAAVGRTPANFTKNMIMRSTSVGVSLATPFDATNSILYCNSYSVMNPHPFDPATINENRTWSGNVFDGLTYDNSGDWLLPNTATPANPYTLTVTNNVYLPSPIGDNIGTPITCYGNPKLTIVFDNNTYTMGSQGVSYGEAQGIPVFTGYANMWQSFRSNLAWNSSVSTSGGFLMWDALGPAYDAYPASITVADYNGKYNYATTWGTVGYDSASLARGYLTGSSAGSNYAFQPGTTPGDHDVTANPNFVDNRRSVATFDQGYLGKSAGTPWAVGTSYNVGDIVSVTIPGVLFGQTVNYRCKKAHASTSQTTPYDANSGDMKYGKPMTRIGSTVTMITTTSVSYTLTFRTANLSAQGTTGSLAASATAATVASAVQTVARTVTGDATIVVTGSGGPISSSPITLAFTSAGGTPYAVGFMTGQDTGGGILYCDDWLSYWEPASLYWIRQSVLAGTTYTDASLGISGESAIGACRAWIRAGWAPTNAAFKGAGYNGVDIGAVSVVTLGTYGPFYNFICGD